MSKIICNWLRDKPNFVNKMKVFERYEAFTKLFNAGSFLMHSLCLTINTFHSQ